MNKWKYFKIHRGDGIRFYRANQKRVEFLQKDSQWWQGSSFNNLEEIQQCTINPNFCEAVAIRDLPIQGRFAKSISIA